MEWEKERDRERQREKKRERYNTSTIHYSVRPVEIGRKIVLVIIRYREIKRERLERSAIN